MDLAAAPFVFPALQSPRQTPLHASRRESRPQRGQRSRKQFVGVIRFCLVTQVSRIASRRFKSRRTQWQEYQEKHREDIDRALARIESEWLALTNVYLPLEIQPAPLMSRQLLSASLDLLRPFAVPVETLARDKPLPQRRREWAPMALLGDDFDYFENYVTSAGSRRLSGLGLGFGRALSICERPGAGCEESTIKDTATLVDFIADVQSPPLLDALQSSMLLVRQSYVRAARFGYFLKKSRQASVEDAQHSDTNFDLDEFVSSHSLNGLVNFVSFNTLAASEALTCRANLVFGDELALINEFHKGSRFVTRFHLQRKSRSYLDFEGAAFGAALFEAERLATKTWGVGAVHDNSSCGAVSPPSSS